MRFFSVALFGAVLSVLSMPSLATTFKIATISPDGSSWMQAMRKAGRDIEQATSGRVKFKFYPGGVMGDDKAVLRKIRIRQLQGTATTAGALAGIAPETQVYNMALTFENKEEVDYVRNKMDDAMLKAFEDKGLVPFGLAEGGFAYIMSKGPIRSPEDLKNFKTWIPNSDPVTSEVSKNLGISPIPLSLGDVLPSLQTGLIDAVATSPIGALALQWHTQVTHLTKVPLIYVYALLVVDKKAFAKLSPEDQATTREIMGKAYQDIDRQNRKDNQEAFAALRTQGIEIIEPSPAEAQQWHQLRPMMQRVMQDYGNVPTTTIDSLLRHVQDFRAQ